MDLKENESANEKQHELDISLFKAIDSGKVDEVVRLIEEGANVNVKMPIEYDFLGRHHGKIITVGKAVMGDAYNNPNQQSNKGSSFRLDKFGKVKNSTPIMHSIRYGHKNIFSEQHGHFEITKVLINNGADLDFVASDKIYPLLLLSLDANAKLIKLLLENGASVVNKDSNWDWVFYMDFCKILKGDFYLEDGKTSTHDLVKEAIENSVEYQEKQKKACFVATMVYDDVNCPEITILRQWRDEVLLRYQFGRIFIKFYYLYGSKIAIALSRSQTSLKLTKRFLDSFINYLSRKKFIKNNID